VSRLLRALKKRRVVALVLVLLVGAAIYLMTRPSESTSTTPPSPPLATPTQTSTAAATVTATPSLSPSASVSPTRPTASATPSTSARPSAQVSKTANFNGYTVALPKRSVLVGATKGKYGEVRSTYRTPAGEKVMTIAFSADFGWSEFSEELTAKCPRAAEGKQKPISWGGSYDGGYTGWDMKGCTENLVTFTTFSDVENVAVVYYGATTPPAWLIKAIEQAVWTE